ncbi:MAG: CPBP family intramembrane metalloprotease [Bacteroidales bacterium]|nr:MAG: CPBP family intramembrane metalloprotease [Bacteroidales bacterium]
MKLLSAIFSRSAKYPDVLLVMTGIFIFALYIHEGSWLIVVSFAGLFLSALIIGNFIITRHNLYIIFGSFYFSWRLAGYIAAGLVAGSALALVFRHFFSNSLFPGTFAKFTIIAPLIGISEELIFRGYVQGRIRESSRVISVAVAAGGHTLYKFILLKTLTDSSGIDFPFLITWTLIGGVIFGTLRDLSDNILPPSLAHACFDILVYGGLATAPFWVWA